MRPGVYQRVLGDAFDELSEPLKRMHDSRSHKRWEGRGDVVREPGLLRTFLAVCARLPRNARDIPIAVDFDIADDGETWTRDFAGQRMRSSLSAREGLLIERLGLLKFSYALSATPTEIRWQVKSVSSFGIALPLAWFAQVTALESLVDGRYTFDVRAVLPIVGLLIHYRGWLIERE